MAFLGQYVNLANVERGRFLGTGMMRLSSLGSMSESRIVLLRMFGNMKRRRLITG